MQFWKLALCDVTRHKLKIVPASCKTIVFCSPSKCEWLKLYMFNRRPITGVLKAVNRGQNKMFHGHLH